MKLIQDFIYSVLSGFERNKTEWQSVSSESVTMNRKYGNLVTYMKVCEIFTYLQLSIVQL